MVPDIHGSHRTAAQADARSGPFPSYCPTVRSGRFMISPIPEGPFKQVVEPESAHRTALAVVEGKI